jgi:hypothetical protein
MGRQLAQAEGLRWAPGDPQRDQRQRHERGAQYSPAHPPTNLPGADHLQRSRHQLISPAVELAVTPELGQRLKPEQPGPEQRHPADQRRSQHGRPVQLAIHELCIPRIGLQKRSRGSMRTGASQSSSAVSVTRRRTGRLYPSVTPDAPLRPASPRSVGVTDDAQAGFAPSDLPLRGRSTSPTTHRQALPRPTCLSAVGQRHRRRTGRLCPVRPASPRSVNVTDDAQAGSAPSDLPLRGRSTSPTTHRQALTRPTCLSAVGRRHRRRTGRLCPVRPASPRSVNVTDDAQAGFAPSDLPSPLSVGVTDDAQAGFALA